MAQTLKFGNGTWATKKGSTLAYNDQNNRYKPLPFTTTRASGATRVNKQGLIEVVEGDRPRIDYTDSADGVLLLEPSSTNLITYSEDFSDASWLTNQATVAITSDIAPDGTTNSVYNYVGNDSNLYTISQAFGVEYTISFYVKSNNQGADDFKFRLGNGFSASLSATSEWVRHTFTATPTTSVFSIASDGVSDVNILVWGAQLEQGNYATSYIPTQGSTVTRVADTASGAGNSEVFNNIEGTIFIDANFKNNSGVQILCSVHDFATNKRLEIWANSNLVNGFIGGSSNITVGSSNLINGSHKIALSYKSGNSSFYIDGFLIGSNSSSFTISALTELSLGYYNTTQYQSISPTKEVGYYDTTLTDEELEYMTSYRTLNELVTELNLKAL